MKTKIFNHVAIVLLLLGSFSSCTERSENDFSEPIEIPITEYSLNETGSWWTNAEPQKVIVINNSKELKKYLACTEGNCTYHSIDFSKNTLLLVSGQASANIIDIQTKLIKRADYEFYVDAYVGVWGVAPVWHIAVLSPQKIKNNVKLNQKQIDFIER